MPIAEMIESKYEIRMYSKEKKHFLLERILFNGLGGDVDTFGPYYAACGLH